MILGSFCLFRVLNIFDLPFLLTVYPSIYEHVVQKRITVYMCPGCHHSTFIPTKYGYPPWACDRESFQINFDNALRIPRNDAEAFLGPRLRSF